MVGESCDDHVASNLTTHSVSSDRDCCRSQFLAAHVLCQKAPCGCEFCTRLVFLSSAVCRENLENCKQPLKREQMKPLSLRVKICTRVTWGACPCGCRFLCFFRRLLAGVLNISYFSEFNNKSSAVLGTLVGKGHSKQSAKTSQANCGMDATPCPTLDILHEACLFRVSGELILLPFLILASFYTDKISRKYLLIETSVLVLFCRMCS